jgi:hypothetical protein
MAPRTRFAGVCLLLLAASGAASARSLAQAAPKQQPLGAFTAGLLGALNKNAAAKAPAVRGERRGRTRGCKAWVRRRSRLPLGPAPHGPPPLNCPAPAPPSPQQAAAAPAAGGLLSSLVRQNGEDTSGPELPTLPELPPLPDTPGVLLGTIIKDVITGLTCAVEGGRGAAGLCRLGAPRRRATPRACWLRAPAAGLWPASTQPKPTLPSPTTRPQRQ